MAIITYVKQELKVQVFVEGRLAGWIKQDGDCQYYYQPKGTKVKSPYFYTIDKVKSYIK